MSQERSDKTKSVLTIIIVFIVALFMFRVCANFSDNVENDPLNGVDNVY